VNHRLRLETLTVDLESLQVLHEAGEGAIALLGSLLEAEEAVLGSVGDPLRMDGQVFFHALVTNVKVLITPAGGGHLTCCHNFADKLLSTTELLRVVPGVDVPKSGSLRDRH